MGIIYKATNAVNGKSYIGQSIYPLAKRAEEHRRDVMRGRDCKFHRAIRKYGFNNFTFEEIEVIPDGLLDEREIYWIAYYDTFKHGYNSTLGGGGSLRVDKSAIETLWESGASRSEIVKELGYCMSSVGDVLSAYENYTHADAVRRGKANQMRQVNQYDLDGNYIQTYSSIVDAAKSCNVDRSLISLCCRKHICSGAMYQWRYADDAQPGKCCLKNRLTKPVAQLNMDGETICEYGSIREASRSTGANRNVIAKCCNGQRKTAGGYAWKYLAGEVS